ncbi:uncharacterized protein EI90DRAFT_2906526 [Cantharellus anzutake]|uniref:uncharacterized protein n=1 Tax=Cantharellus anzutake TaxID=1750568 RepID=UPI0019049257|nr:uncharacterized protein EI90DRAFT_2906526 [Cantharellus anzutake]KAF8340618.1 hypothetical protein EI90DRAFT_2906526 [Cantharellus anzutake]
MFETNYRVFFAKSVARLLTPPLLIAYFISRFFLGPLDALFAPFFYLLVSLIWATFVVQSERLYQRFDARRRGAVLVPEVKGRLPGNIDIIFRSLRCAREGYPLSDDEERFEELNADTINLRLLWSDIILTREPQIVQSILATNFIDFEKGLCSKFGFLFGLFGDGIFNNDGEDWKAHRALTRPFFARERVRDYDLFSKYSNIAISLIQHRSLQNESLDVQDLFGRLTLDAAGEFLFGTTDLQTLSLPLPPSAKRSKLGPKGTQPDDTVAVGTYSGFVRAFEQIQVSIIHRFRVGPLWPLFEWFKDSTQEHNEAIDAWIAPLITQALENKKMRAGKGLTLEEGSLTDHLAESTTDVKLIRDELMNILLAARDTTASLLTFMCYFLAIYPEVLKKLREEILTSLPKESPSYEDMRNLKYLRACLNETLRLFPPVPYNARASVKATTLPRASPLERPFYMPGPHASISYPTLLMHRRKDLWGEDADDFLPERWLDAKRLRELTMDPFRFLPFNAGPRICLGQNFAYNEASFVMVKLLQNFDTFELRQKQDAPEGALPPEFWKNLSGRAACEQVWPQNAITLYAKVRTRAFLIRRETNIHFQTGRSMDLYGHVNVPRMITLSSPY